MAVPTGLRTCDLRFRKPLLYPAELRDHALKLNTFWHIVFGRKRLCYRVCYGTPSFLFSKLIFAFRHAWSSLAAMPPCIVGHIEINRGGDAGMSEALLGNRRMNVGQQQRVAWLCP